MRDHVAGDRLGTPHRVDLGAGAFERRDDPAELVEVTGDREDAPFRQRFPRVR